MIIDMVLLQYAIEMYTTHYLGLKYKKWLQF